MPGPLAGLKVVELAGLGPAPSCSMMLGDMGADVIRVDRVSKSGLGIEIPARYNLRDRNKRSIAIDLKHAKGIATLLQLVQGADVLIEGFRPGVAERLGFGPDACLSLRPSLVYARATGWGQEGPLAQTAGHDINYVALTGALDLIGPAEGEPVLPLNLLGDYAGGAAYLAFGIMCAVFEVNRSGQGQVIDGAIVDGVASLLTMFHAMRQSGELAPGRGNNLLDGGAPFYTTYPTKDGLHVAVGALETHFYAAFVVGLGLESAALPDRGDRSNWPALRARFAARFAERTRSEWTEHFAVHPDACVSPVLELAEAPNFLHNKLRGMMTSMAGVEHPLPAPRLSRTPGEIISGPPHPGEHTVAILLALGVEPAAIEEGLELGYFLAHDVARFP